MAGPHFFSEIRKNGNCRKVRSDRKMGDYLSNWHYIGTQLKKLDIFVMDIAAKCGIPILPDDLKKISMIEPIKNSGMSSQAKWFAGSLWSLQGKKGNRVRIWLNFSTTSPWKFWRMGAGTPRVCRAALCTLSSWNSIPSQPFPFLFIGGDRRHFETFINRG